MKIKTNGKKMNRFEDKHTVPNTGVDINALRETLYGISKTFLNLIYYLSICISESCQASDSAFERFMDTILASDNDAFINKEKDPLRKIIDIIAIEIL